MNRLSCSLTNLMLSFALLSCGAEVPSLAASEATAIEAAACPTPPPTFALISRDASSLAGAVSAAHAACPRTGGSWCSVGPQAAFSSSRCLAMRPTLGEVTAAAVAETDPRGVFDVRYGRSLTRSELLLTQAFRTSLLNAVDAFARDTDVQATVFESEESCHNCHQFSLKYVLHYTRTRTIVVIDGSHGYDS